MTTFAFLGFGDVGRHFAPVIDTHPDHQVIGALVRTGASTATRSRLQQAGVVELPDSRALARAEVVISAVTPDTALSVARQALPGLGSGQVYLDVNSTTPMLKRDIADVVVPSGATVVDAMLSGAGTSVDGAKVPIALAGPKATDLATVLRGCGFVVEAISDRVGTAAALKMARGIVIKGLDALAFEARMVADHYGIHGELMASLSESLDRIPIQSFLDMLFDTHCSAAPRRAAEAVMIRQTAESAGVTPIMSEAIAAFFAVSVEIDQLAHLDPDRSISAKVSQARRMRREHATSQHETLARSTE